MKRTRLIITKKYARHFELLLVKWKATRAPVFLGEMPSFQDPFGASVVRNRQTPRRPAMKREDYEGSLEDCPEEEVGHPMALLKKT